MNYTSIEQSKRLLKLGLDHSSADMYWMHGMLDNVKQHSTPDIIGNDSDEPIWKTDLPCWSVGALQSLAPVRHINIDPNFDGEVVVIPELIGEHQDNPVDACVALIEKLHELKML